MSLINSLSQKMISVDLYTLCYLIQPLEYIVCSVRYVLSVGQLSNTQIWVSVQFITVFGKEEI